MWQVLRMIEYACARRCESRHRFKVSIGERHRRIVEHERQRSKERIQHPCYRYDKVSLAATERSAGFPPVQAKQLACADKNQYAPDEWQLVVFAIADGNDEAIEHQRCFQPKQRTKYLTYNLVVQHIFKFKIQSSKFIIMITIL